MPACPSSPDRSLPSARWRQGSALVIVALAVVGVAGVFAAGRLLGPATAHYRRERIDRGPIRTEVVARGRVTALPWAPDQSRLEVSAEVRDVGVRAVAVGQAVTVRGGDCPSCVSTGTVSEVRLGTGSAADVETSTVLVEADNRAHKLRPGMTASVSIEVARRDGVLRLPLPALAFTPQGERAAPIMPPAGRVFVLDGDGRPRPVSVTVGLRDAVHVEEVAGPLGEGDAVLVGESW